MHAPAAIATDATPAGARPHRRRSRRRRLMLVALGLIAALGLGIGVYDVVVAIGIEREAAGRLADPAVRARLAPVSHDGRADRPAVLLLHGFGGSPADLAPIAEALIAAGATVRAPLLPGHGGDSARVLATATRAQWQAAAAEAYRTLARDHKNTSVVGFSLGGLLALDLAHKEPGLTRVVVINPYTSVPYRWYYALPIGAWRTLLRPLVPYVRKTAPGQIDDPAGRARYEPSYGTLSLAALGELDRLAEAVWSAALPADADLLFCYALGDRVSDPAEMGAAAERLCQDPGDAVRVYERSNHVLPYDTDAPALIADVSAFLIPPTDSPPADIPPTGAAPADPP